MKVLSLVLVVWQEEKPMKLLELNGVVCPVSSQIEVSERPLLQDVEVQLEEL